MWLQAKLTISLAPYQDKFAKLFFTIAAELWLRGRQDAIDITFQLVARSVTIRLAETLAQYICSLMRHAAALATPETECLLYATYWFRPILSELIGAATETAETNRDRAPSGPVKVTVTTQPHSRPYAGVTLISGVSALLAWFPASWASKIAPYFLDPHAGAAQHPQEVSLPCPTRDGSGPQRDPLMTTRFVDKKAPVPSPALEEDFQAAQSFSEVTRGYGIGLVEPSVMQGFRPVGHVRVTLEVIIPSPSGITPEQWKQTATLCPLDWPSNYSLLRLWHHPKSLHQFASLLREQLGHSHIFSHWSVHPEVLASRVLFQQPANYFSEAALQADWRALEFPSRKIRRFRGRVCRAAENGCYPVSYALANNWAATSKADTRYYQENTVLRTT